MNNELSTQPAVHLCANGFSQHEVETGWLLELAHGSAPCWLTAESNLTKDANEALRFGRKKDGLDFLKMLHTARFGKESIAGIMDAAYRKTLYIVTEHQFINTRAAKEAALRIELACPLEEAEVVNREELLGDAIRQLINGSIRCSDDLPIEKRPVHVSARRAFGAVYTLLRAATRAPGVVVGADFVLKTNTEYAAWCKTFYQADSLDERGMASLHGLWAWQEQERRALEQFAQSRQPSEAGELSMSVFANKDDYDEATKAAQAPAPAVRDGGQGKCQPTLTECPACKNDPAKCPMFTTPAPSVDAVKDVERVILTNTQIIRDLAKSIAENGFTAAGQTMHEAACEIEAVVLAAQGAKP